jgi:glycosyltransferase involved in cell wall biosynthesis
VSSGNLVFAGTASNEDLPAIYSKHAVLVNLTPSGSLDKVIFEAMACGVVPIVSNVSLLDVLPDGLVMRNVDPETITQTLRAVLTGKINCETMALRQYVVEKHSLTRLADLLPNYV